MYKIIAINSKIYKILSKRNRAIAKSVYNLDGQSLSPNCLPSGITPELKKVARKLAGKPPR